MRSWYRISAVAAPDVAELYIFDEIGASYWNDNAVGAKAFIDDLRELPESVKTIRVHVNSPGGSVFEAMAIASALRTEAVDRGRAIDVVIEGLAASAATIVTSAGDTIRMAAGALMMVHAPRGYESGTSSALRKMADVLDTTRDSMIALYRRVSPLSPEALVALLEAETWMTPAEAMANGFITEVIGAVDVAAKFDPSALSRVGAVPDRHRLTIEAFAARPAPEAKPPAAASAVDVLRACREADVLDLAETLISASATMDDVQARVRTEREARAQAAARKTEITALCETAKLPELAQGYVAGAMSVTDVRAHLTVVTAKLDTAVTDGSLPPPVGSGVRQQLNPSAIYAERNRLTTTKES